MQLSVRDKETLRRLAGQYSAIAHMEVQKERIDRYYRTNALESVRPVVLIDEVPWGEIKDEALTNVCEPMDRKIDILRKRFKNLRKISITPWADARRAAEAIGRDYVMAAKPNPAFVASLRFDPAPVEAEIARYCEACREHGTTLEFVIKDISTIANNPENLTQWAATVNATIDRYYA